MTFAAPEAVSFAAYRDFVRWQLRRFGASSDAVDDLTQEVWAVSLARSPRLANDAATRAWLIQVCRRVVASDRRSRARMPLLREPAPEIRVAPEQTDHLDARHSEQQRLAAFARLSDAQIDLLTLYGGGHLSMREVAELLGAPEQTVYSQYRAAVERASRELRLFSARAPERALRHQPGEAHEPDGQGAPHESSGSLALVDHDEDRADFGKFISYRNDDEVSLGRIGNVVLCRWRDRAFAQTTRALEMAIRSTHVRMQTPMVVVSDLDPGLKVPNAEERKALRDHIRTTSELVSTAVDVITIAPLRHMISAVIGGIMLFTRSPTAFIIVGTVQEACRAIAPYGTSARGSLSLDELERAFAELRKLPLSESPGSSR